MEKIQMNANKSVRMNLRGNIWICGIKTKSCNFNRITRHRLLLRKLEFIIFHHFHPPGHVERVHTHFHHRSLQAGIGNILTIVWYHPAQIHLGSIGADQFYFQHDRAESPEIRKIYEINERKIVWRKSCHVRI